MSGNTTQVRRLSKPDRDAIGATLGEYLAERIVTALQDATKTCLACDHFRDKDETCGLNSKRPPARIIAFGCEMFIECVPF